MILAFETDELDALVDCIRRLRDSKTRLYTKVETPFFTGIRKPIADCLDDLRWDPASGWTEGLIVPMMTA